MSGDNAILILKTNNEYRVGHFSAIDNLYWFSGKDSENLVSLKIFEYFHDCHIIIGWNNAINLASVLYEDMEYVEYGIQIINSNKTWKQIVEEARQEVEDEISFTYNNRNYSGNTKVQILDKLKILKKEMEKEIQ